MKMNFKQNKPLIIVIIVVLSALCISAVTATAIEISKKSDPLPKGDSYGSYYDNNKPKEKEISLDSGVISLTYVRTENLKELPASKRADHYGTYDIYEDENKTEYMFLLDSDIYCGYRMSTVGIPTLKEDAIEEDKALEIADAFLNNTRKNGKEYVLFSCEYDELGGYYDIQYYCPVDGYKTDDIFRAWVDAQGAVTAFSEFNYNRYAKLKIASDKYDKASKNISKKISKRVGDADYSVADQYVSIDDSGKLILVNVIDLSTPYGEVSISQREKIVQIIK